MADDQKLQADCYSEGEREGMIRFQQMRALLLGPLLTLMTRLRLTANHITVLSFLAGLGFCVVWWETPRWALSCLLAHAILDGLDGPLARHQRTDSAQGSLTDSMCDQLVVTASMIVLMLDERIGIVAGSTYIFCYAIVVAFAMVRNAIQQPYSWVLRPRFYVYAWVAAEVLWLGDTGWSDAVIWACNVPLAWKTCTGFLAIRRSLGPGRDPG